MDKTLNNLNQALFMAMDAYPNRTCFRIQRDRWYENISYRRFQNYVLRLIPVFRRYGIEAGERVVIAGDNSLEWMLSYVACLLAGGAVIPLRPSLAPDLLEFILKDAEVSLAILSDSTRLAAISRSLTTDQPEKLPHLKGLLCLTQPAEQVPGVLPLTKLLEEVVLPDLESQKAIRAHAEQVSPEALASIFYVNSETSWPKGAVFDHGQQVKMIQSMARWFILSEDDLAMIISAWSELPGLASALHCFISGVANIAVQGDYDEVVEAMQQTSPTVMMAAPFFFERFYDSCMVWLSEQPESNQQVFQWALAKGKEYLQAGDQATSELRHEYVRADLTFFSQIRGQVGGRLRLLYSTGASLNTKLAEFFDVIGLPTLNLYSLTEAGGFPAVNRPEARRFQSCGQVMPGFEICIASDGEILVRGRTVMRAYWQRAEESQKAFDEVGWLHSGDVGYLDEAGYLYINGRKQQFLVLSTGRKIIPSTIEKALMESPFISHATVFGDGKPYISALIVPDLEGMVSHFSELEETDLEAQLERTSESEANGERPNWLWRHESDNGDLVMTVAHPKVKDLIDSVVEAVNSHLDQFEQIRQYSLLEQAYSKTANEFAEALAFGRELLAEQYASEINTMYPQQPQTIEKRVTQVEVSPERLRELLEKESILDAWMTDAGIEFLFELARKMRIDVPSMVNLCDAAASIAQMEHEEKPLSTAFIVGDPGRISRILPTSQVQLLYHDHIRRMRKVLTSMTQIVDGMVLGYVVDKYGYVRGISRLEVDLEMAPSYLLGPQFRRHAAISQQCDAVVFFVPTGGRQVRVFAQGQLVGRFSNGDWSPESMLQIDKIVADLAEEVQFDLSLIRRILKCAFTMSEENLGAIFMIGEADEILRHSDISEISAFAAITGTSLDYLTDRELVNFAKQDGATIIDKRGYFRGCMILLRPDAKTQAEIGPGRGSRHSSAAKMSVEVNSIAITVSQDGPITVYRQGRQILSI